MRFFKLEKILYDQSESRYDFFSQVRKFASVFFPALAVMRSNWEWMFETFPAFPKSWEWKGSCCCLQTIRWRRNDQQIWTKARLHFTSKQESSKPWLKKSAVGQNKLNSLLSKMAEKAGLGSNVKNYSSRKTMIQALTNNDIPATDIIQLYLDTKTFKVWQIIQLFLKNSK